MNAQGSFAFIEEHMEFFISPPEKGNWIMPAAEFVSHLLRRWPSARVRAAYNSDLSPEWEMEMPGGVFMGNFYPPLSGVAFSGGTFEDLATFAAWFRSLVPSEQTLLFYQEGFNWDMELKPNTTAQEIVAALNEA